MIKYGVYQRNKLELERKTYGTKTINRTYLLYESDPTCDRPVLG